jgi:hypothetical protein
MFPQKVKSRDVSLPNKFTKGYLEKGLTFNMANPKEGAYSIKACLALASLDCSLRLSSALLNKTYIM